MIGAAKAGPDRDGTYVRRARQAACTIPALTY